MTDSPALKAFLDRIYDEAFEVLVDLRDFVASDIVEEKADIPPESRDLAVREVSRATQRMADVMAWLLLQKAIQAGEVDPADAPNHAASRFGAEPLEAPNRDPEALEKLPVALRGLIDRSRRVYEKTVQIKERGE